MPDAVAESYAALASTRKTNPFLVHALARTRLRPGRALDLGAGAFGETRYLLRRGFAVDAVDRDPISRDLSAGVDPHGGRFAFFHAAIEDFAIPSGTYDLVVALHVLPMLAPGRLPTVAANVVAGLRPGGVLCCTLFGERDSWVLDGKPITATSEARAAELFAELRPLVHAEVEYDGADATGQLKHWHVFRQILVKPQRNG